MEIRKPAVAGQFYAGQYETCLRELQNCIAEQTVPEDLPENIFAGIVPHAGWMFSGDLAALVFSSLKHTCEKVNSFVLFGAVHYYRSDRPAVYNRGSWLTPIGEIAVDEELADAIEKCSDSAIADCNAHSSEHSIEVQVPFIQHLFPGARIVPILVPPTSNAVEFGKKVGELIAGMKDKKIVCIGSTDLTHYGPRYGFCPEGIGEEGIKWAKEVNDQEFIDLAIQMQPVEMIASAMQNQNACGSAAVAAAVSAAKAQGVTKGHLLAHTHSNEVMIRKMGQSSEESVGYAAIVF